MSGREFVETKLKSAQQLTPVYQYDVFERFFFLCLQVSALLDNFKNTVM
jgi:hypothetical protein